MTDTVRRFNYIGDDAEMVVESDGEFVRYSDYEQLQSRLAQREQEWKAFENFGKRLEADLRAQLAQVTQDRERLLRGDFTPEEFQNLCHNTDIQAGFDAFADGCEAYQQKMFGRCRTKGTPE